jgi:xylulokinase
LIERLGGAEACFNQFGIVPRTGYTASKLLWMKRHEPDNFYKIRHILLPHDYLNFWLTGKIYAECGDASGTGFFDVRKRSWAEEVLNEIDGGSGQLYRALPELLGSEQIVGTLRQDVAREFGLPVDCVVATGGGDNMMGAIGTGNVREGMVTLSLGTSATVYSYSDRPVLDASGNVAPFCSSTGGWLPLVCTMNATNVVTQTLNVVGKAIADIDAALASTTPGAEGLCFLPFLNGERTPDLPTAQGSITGISANNFTSANLIRGVIEGVSFGILSGLDLILGAKRAESIFMIGGGARSSEWRQLLADVTDVSIQVPAETEAGCLGAAMQAIYAYSNREGKPQSFAEIAERCVRIEESKTMYPREEKHQMYRQVLKTYRRNLGNLCASVQAM